MIQNHLILDEVIFAVPKLGETSENQQNYKNHTFFNEVFHQ